jgi:hypothetical protein
VKICATKVNMQITRPHPQCDGAAGFVTIGLKP